MTSWITAWALGVFAGASAGADDANAPEYGRHTLLATAQTNSVGESSGVAPSHFDADIFWTHNDSGSAPRVYAVRLSAADRRKKVAVSLGYVELRGATCVDWEDLAAGPRNRLYVFDGGNNPPCNRKDKRILSFVEPKPDTTGRLMTRMVRWEAARFEYPDPAKPGTPATRDEDRYDAECLLVHPTTGDMYIVTKRDNHSQAVAKLYRLPAASVTWNNRTVHVLEYVADLTKQIPGASLGGVAAEVTGGDVRADGRQVVLRTYLAACLFTLPAGRPFEAVFKSQPQELSLIGEPQGEGICYAWNWDLITTSEAHGSNKQCPVYITPAKTHPASAPTP